MLKDFSVNTNMARRLVGAHQLNICRSVVQLCVRLTLQLDMWALTFGSAETEKPLCLSAVATAPTLSFVSGWTGSGGGLTFHFSDPLFHSVNLSRRSGNVCYEAVRQKLRPFRDHLEPRFQRLMCSGAYFSVFQHFFNINFTFGYNLK